MSAERPPAMRSPVVAAFALLAAACGVAPAVIAQRGRLEQLERGPLAREAQRDAPHAFAEAARALEAARAVRAAGGPAFEWRVDEAALALEWASTQARVARARERVREASVRLSDVSVDIARMEERTEQIEAELTRRAADAAAVSNAQRGVAAPGGVPAADRAAVADDVRQQAELLFAAARMLGAESAQREPVAERLRAATTAAQGRDPTVALVAAGRAYRAAEDLVRELRLHAPAAAGATDATQLVTELSNAGGLEPRQDARGVVTILRGLFTTGATFARTSDARLAAMARIVASHADARVRVEAFVGGSDRALAERAATAQAAAVVAALVRHGVPQAHVEAAGIHRTPGGGRTDDRVETVLVLASRP